MSEAWWTLVACNVKCTHYTISCKGSQRSPTNINWLQEVLESASLKIASTTANKKVDRCQKTVTKNSKYKDQTTKITTLHLQHAARSSCITGYLIYLMQQDLYKSLNGIHSNKDIWVPCKLCNWVQCELHNSHLVSG